MTLNAGDYRGAADQFGAWVKSNGKTLQGLVRRRAEERVLFLNGDEPSAPKPQSPAQPSAPLTQTTASPGLQGWVIAGLAAVAAGAFILLRN